MAAFSKLSSASWDWFFTLPITFTACLEPFCNSLMMDSTCKVDSCVLVASVRTSSATTAKPRPCSPALAASIAALSASKLVCSAIPLMTSITKPISLLFSSSWLITLVVFSTLVESEVIEPIACVAIRVDSEAIFSTFSDISLASFALPDMFWASFANSSIA